MTFFSYLAVDSIAEKSRTADKVAAIIDLALKLQQVENQSSSLDLFFTAMVPQLNHVSASSDSDSSTSSSSFSSMSFDEDDAQGFCPSPPVQSVSSSKTPRSIFKRYWEKKGGAGCIRRAPCTHQPSISEDNKNTCCSKSYERSLQENEDTTTTKKLPSQQRRRIFDNSCISESEPTLNLIKLHQGNFRKAQSTSILEQRKPRQSCLRSSRFSGKHGCKDSDATDNSSVSFKKKVDVVVYEVPTEFYSQEGWSDYFN